MHTGSAVGGDEQQWTNLALVMGITLLNVQWLGDQMFLGSVLLLSALVGVLATHLLLSLRSDKSEEILWSRVITRQFRNAHVRVQQQADVLSSRE